MEILIPIGFVALIVGVIAVAWYVEKKRREAWQAVAADLGFEFLARADDFHHDRPFQLFDKGRSRRTTNLLTGEAGGVRVSLADYQYTTGGGKNSSTHRQTVCLVEAPDLDLPRFAIAPEVHIPGFLSGLLELVGAMEHDIDFEDDPEFSEAFHLSGDDEEAVRAFFTPELRRWCLENLKPGQGGRGAHDRLVVEASGDSMLLHVGKTVKPGECRDLMEQAFDLMGVFGGARTG